LPWRSNSRSPAATSSGLTVHMMTMCDFPMSDIVRPFILRCDGSNCSGAAQARQACAICSGARSPPLGAAVQHNARVCSLDVEGVETWATPGILEALIPGRMQGHGGTEEVPG